MTKLEFLHKTTARLRHNAIWMPIMRATGRNIKNKNWIFIVGCYNSGTTLLDQILSHHPQISGLPDEGVMLTNQLVRPEDFGWRRMWAKCQDKMESAPTNRHKNATTIKKHWSHFYDLKKPFLLEKSISNTDRIPFFNKEFHPVYFIHLVRNGYAVAEGIYRKAEIMPGNPYYGQAHYPMELCAKQWTTSLKEVERHKPNLKNFLEIKYEDLTREPEKIVNNILDFLKLEHFPAGYLNNSFTVHEKKSEIKNMNPSSFKRLEKRQIMRVNKVAEDYLKQYNYPVL